MLLATQPSDSGCQDADTAAEHPLWTFFATSVPQSTFDNHLRLTLASLRSRMARRWLS